VLFEQHTLWTCQPAAIPVGLFDDLQAIGQKEL
jgi:hypothetical protein